MGAPAVPETRDLDSEDAWQILRRVHYGSLAQRSLRRFRRADGFSYARAVAFQMVLALIPALIFFAAVAVWAGSDTLRSSVQTVLTTMTPGPTGGFLQQAVDQGQRSGHGDLIALLAGGLTALGSGTVGMSQIQQGAGRLYGKDQDRSPLKRYAIGLGLSLSAGLLLGAALVAIAFGRSIAGAVEGESVWIWLRWPLGAAAAILAMALLYKVAPNRNQPSLSWLALGGITATVLWLLFSGGLALYLSVSSTFGKTYGSLAGLIGVLIWSELTALALLAGLAFTAELEWERAGGRRSDPAEGLKRNRAASGQRQLPTTPRQPPRS